MRPEITGSLERRVERAVDKHGYDTPTELVREATRGRIEELERHEKHMRAR